MIFNSYNILDIIAVALAAVISIVLHEYAHGIVALWNGDYTAKGSGRLTLNPIKHFDPIGFLMLVTVGFGFAKPVPVNPNNFKKLRRGIFTVSIAGIVVNIILAFFSALFASVFFYSVLKNGTISSFGYKLSDFFYTFFRYMLSINVCLALFNLLPFYPLDGFRIVEAFTRYNNKVTKFLREYGQYILIGLIAVSIIIDLFNLVQYAPVFEYFDLIGLYMRYVGGGIQRGFLWLLGLMF